MTSIRIKLEGIRDDIINGITSRRDISAKRIEINTKMSKIKNGYKVEIVNAVDPATKKVMYSNAQKRDSALADVLEKDEKYNALQCEIDNLDEEIQDVDIKLESARYSFKVEEIISKLGE